MPEQARLDVILGERLLQQRIVVEIDLPDRQIVGGGPVGVNEGKLPVRKGLGQRLPPRDFYRLWVSPLLVMVSRRIRGSKHKPSIPRSVTLSVRGLPGAMTMPPTSR